MFTFDLLIPWLTLATVLVPLLFIQRWIHRHLFGMGYLISQKKDAATFFYYLLLLPGVILHEFSHYMMAGVFGIPSKRWAFFPEAQEDGSLEMGFVQLEDVKNPVYAGFIGVAPLLAGMGVVVLISNNILDLPAFFASFKSADINVIGAAFQKLVSKPDFFLWTYLLFAISNAMMPQAEDRRGWWIVGAVTGGLLLFLTVIGFQVIVVNWLSGPIAAALYSLTAVFGTVLILDSVAAMIIWMIEMALERVTGHHVEYQPMLGAGKAAQPAKRLASVYELSLPLPPPPGKVPAPIPRRIPAAAERPALGAGAAPKPALSSTAGQPEGARPGLPAGPGKPAIAPPATPARTTGEQSRVAPGTPEKKTTGETPKAPAPGIAPKPASPFGGTSNKPGEAPKPASPFGSPAKPGEPSKAPAAPGPGIAPKPASPFGGTSNKPGEAPKPASPFGSPAKPGAEPSKAPAASTGSPAKPGSPFGGTSNKPGEAPKPSSPFGSPAKPGEPAKTPGGQPGAKPPISGPPALARPAGPPAKPGQPTPPGSGTPPRSPFGSPAPRPGDPRSRFPSSKDDYIDADVIEDDEEDQEDDGELKYVDDPDL